MYFLGSREMLGSLSAWYFPCTRKPPHFISPLSNCFPKHFRIHVKESCLLRRQRKKKTQPIAKRHRSRGNPLHWCDWITQPLWLTSGKQKKKNKLLIQTSELIYRRSSPLPWQLYRGRLVSFQGCLCHWLNQATPQLHCCLLLYPLSLLMSDSSSAATVCSSSGEMC